MQPIEDLHPGIEAMPAPRSMEPSESPSSASGEAAPEASTTLATVLLCQEIDKLCAVERKTESLLCRYLADLADRFGRWDPALQGFSHIYEYARIRFGMDQRLVRERVRVGKAVRALPQIGAAFDEGKLGYAQVREVTRVAEPSTDVRWLNEARRLPLRTLEERVADQGRRARKEQAKPVAPPQEEKVLVDLHLRLTPAAWAALQQAVALTRQKLGKALSVAEAIEVLAKDALAAVGRTARNLGGGAVRRATPVPAQTTSATGDGECREAQSAGVRSEQGGDEDIEGAAVDQVSTGPVASEVEVDGSPDATPLETKTPGGQVLPSEVAARLGPEAITLLDIMGTREGWDQEELIQKARFSATQFAVGMLDLQLAGLAEALHTGFRATNPAGFC